jgi:hypothetical protein
MSHSENSALRSLQNRLTSRSGIGVSVLLLALAVFGWGLHSKLSLYHVRARDSETAPIAKLLSERERPADAAQNCYAEHADLFVPASPVSIILMPSSEHSIRAKRPREEAPPLPSRAITFKGSSLRRPFGMRRSNRMSISISETASPAASSMHARRGVGSAQTGLPWTSQHFVSPVAFRNRRSPFSCF